MTCPTPTAGSVTDQTGFFTTMVGGICDKTGAVFQNQYMILLTDKADACAHYQQYQVVKGEKWLTFALVAGHTNPANLDPVPNPDIATVPAAPGTPGRFNVGEAVYVSGTDLVYVLAADGTRYVPHRTTNCGEQNPETATGGYVQFTTLTDDAVAGSYSLTFASGTLAGTFSVTRCGSSISLGLTGCPTRPSNQTCIAS